MKNAFGAERKANKIKSVPARVVDEQYARLSLVLYSIGDWLVMRRRIIVMVENTLHVVIRFMDQWALTYFRFTSPTLGVVILAE